MGEASRRAAEEGPDVMDQVRGISGLLNDPPYNECDQHPFEDIRKFHCRLPGSADCSIVPVSLILDRNSAWVGVVIQACTVLAMPVRQQVCPQLMGATHQAGENIPTRHVVSRSPVHMRSSHAGYLLSGMFIPWRCLM